MPTQMAARESETESKPGDTGKKKVFVSYNFKDEPFVRRVNYHQLKQDSIEAYCWADAEHDTSFPPEISENLGRGTRPGGSK